MTWTSINLSIVLLLGFFVLLGLWLWLRYRMLVSKARFALVTVATLAACAVALLTFLSGPLPIQIINSALSGTRNLTGINWIPVVPEAPGPAAMVLGFASTIIAMGLIYWFARSAILSWDGPVTVNVNELAKREQDNSLSALAFAEALRIIARQPDPIASDVAVNWQQRQSEAPGTPPWHELARGAFESAFGEALFSENCWRDRFQVWVGEMYVRSAETVPLLLFVFDEDPSDFDVRRRIEAFSQDGELVRTSKIYAICCSSSRKIRMVDGAFRVEIWPLQQLLKGGLKLTSYARDLIRRFDSEPLGGTDATLKDTFVECHVHKPSSSDRVALSTVLASWLSENGRRHLALTGEYGQGKSTAMLDFCVKWARRYLEDGALDERIPLLIELRGHNPAESDPVSFLAAWAGRYGLPPKQLYNLIRAGESIVIFEGFDELRNAGRAYDRHEHFNALWRMAFPGTKLVFTGRPNFFLDEKEKNRTLRADDNKGAAGNAFTDLWELDRLTPGEVRQVAMGYGKQLGESIMKVVGANTVFFDIVSRPSMLPVVATIWEPIERFQKEGHDITNAILLERYMHAIYLRKEDEIEKDRRMAEAPDDASYLLLPREVREVFTLAVVWRMAGLDARNTITRNAFDAVIRQCYEGIFKVFQTEGVRPDIVQAVRKFEERFRDETRNDRHERVSNEIASAGLFVPDPAGGPSNLRLPHKQFYEYMIAKVAWTILAFPNSLVAQIYQSADRQKDVFEKLWREDNSLRFLSELIGVDFSPVKRFYFPLEFALMIVRNQTIQEIKAIGISILRLLRPDMPPRKPRMFYSLEVEKLDAILTRRVRRVYLFMSALVLPASAGLVFWYGPIILREKVFAFDPVQSLVFAFISLGMSMAIMFFYAGWRHNFVGENSRTFVALVAINLSKLPHLLENGRLPMQRLYRECWLLLSNMEKSAIYRTHEASQKGTNVEIPNAAPLI